MSRASPSRRLFDRDRFNMASRPAVAHTAVNALDRIQGAPKEHQVLGLACAFLLLAASIKMPAQEVFTAAKNLMYDPIHNTRMGHQFAGIKQYLEEDVVA